MNWHRGRGDRAKRGKSRSAGSVGEDACLAVRWSPALAPSGIPRCRRRASGTCWSRCLMLSYGENHRWNRNQAADEVGEKFPPPPPDRIPGWDRSRICAAKSTGSSVTSTFRFPSALWPFALRPRTVSAAKGRWRRRWTLSKEPKSPEEDHRQDRAMARMIASSRHSAHW